MVINNRIRIIKKHGGTMKKGIRIIGVVVILFTGTLLSTMVYSEIKNSIGDYISSDLVGDTDEFAEFEVANSRILNVTDNNEKNSFNNNSININDKNTNESKKITDSISKDRIKSDSDDKSRNYTVEIDNTNNVTNETINIDDNSLYSTDRNTIQDIASNAENNQYQSDVQNKTNLQNNVDNIGISGSSQLSMLETDKKKDIVSESVQAALNISNPSIDVDASSAILLDVKTGKVLFHKNATELIYPASTTKLMTALVALDYCKLSEEVTIGDEINMIASDSSRAYLSVGQKMTFETLLEGMLIPSGNDAAYSVATYVGRISLKNKKADEELAVQEFVRLMNEKATALGLKNTNFKNPDGYDDDDQYTTAYDMGIIAINAFKNETIYTISDKSHSRNVFLSGEDVTWNSSNKLIVSGSGMFYKYAVGLKTGTSSLAGRCLVSAAVKDGKECISVVMNSTSVGRWEDSIELLKYGIEKH